MDFFEALQFSVLLGATIGLLSANAEMHKTLREAGLGDKAKAAVTAGWWSFLWGGCLLLSLLMINALLR